ncbi:hypothetical protein Tco_0318147 [Tanacetum coccineum]
MGRDTIQLEDAVSTISGEYLLEFTSEYDIPEGLHPELPGLEDTIVDFSEGKVGAPKDEMPSTDSYSALDVATLNTRRTPFQNQPELLLCIVGLSRRYFLGDDVYPTFLNDDDREMDLFNLISAPNLAKVKTRTRPHATYEVQLVTTTASQVIEIEDPVATSTSSETSSVMEKSPLDFSSEDPSPMITNKGEIEDQAPAVASQEVPSTENTATAEVVPELNLEKEATAKEPPVNKRRRKRDQSAVEGNAPPKVLRKDHASVHPAQDTRGGKSLAAIGLGPEPPSHTSSKIAAVVADPDSENTSFTSMAGSPGSIYQPGWGVTNGCRLDTPGACQDLVDHIAPPGYFSELRHLPNDDFLSQYNINLARQVAMGSQLRLRFEQEAKLLKKSVAQVARRDQRIQARENEIKNLEALLEAEADMKKVAEAKNAKLVEELEGLRAQFSDLQVSNDQLSQQVSTLQAQITGEEKIKAAFEEFKKYEDERVNSRCAEMDARLDKLSVDFDEELYPHMLTAIAGHRWVIGYGLRLAVMKCAELSKIRRAFADVVSAGLAKGMSEGLKYGVEHRKAGQDLADIEAYDPEANSKLIKALQDLKDLKYPMVDQLEKLKDAPMKLIMASLHLESDTGEDAPQWIRNLRPSTSQLKIPVYPEVRTPRDPWAIKEEILLVDAIAANVSLAEKKKKRRWFAVPMGSVPPIMPDLTASQYQHRPLPLKVLLSCWRMLLLRLRYRKVRRLRGCSDPYPYQLCIIWIGHSTVYGTLNNISVCNIFADVRGLTL